MAHEHDPMELAEIAALKSHIRLLEDRFFASSDGSEPRNVPDVEQLQDELARLRAQLKRVEDADRA